MCISIIDKCYTKLCNAKQKNVISKVEHNLQTNDICICVNYWCFALLITCSFVRSFTPSPLSFVLRDFLLAVLTQTSHVGGVFRGASPLANEILSDSSMTGHTVQQRWVFSVL